MTSDMNWKLQYQAPQQEKEAVSLQLSVIKGEFESIRANQAVIASEWHRKLSLYSHQRDVSELKSQNQLKVIQQLQIEMQGLECESQEMRQRIDDLMSESSSLSARHKEQISDWRVTVTQIFQQRDRAKEDLA